MYPWLHHAINCHTYYKFFNSFSKFLYILNGKCYIFLNNVVYRLKQKADFTDVKNTLLYITSALVLNIFQKQIFNKTLYNKPENKHNSKLVTIWYLAFCYQSRREQCIAFEVWIIKPKKIKYQQFIHCGFEGEDMGWLKE